MTSKSDSKAMNYLITGGARGIGRGLARHVLQCGHRVFLVDSNADELKWIDAQLRLTCGITGQDRLSALLLDLRDRQAMRKAIAEAATFFGGKLDVLINNAMATPHIWADGLAMDDGSDDQIMQQWDDKLAVGLTAPFYLSRLCVPLLKAVESGRGCIINIASTRAHQAEDNHEGYSAVKAGILGLSRSMAVSLGHKHGIRVNSIIPGWISVDNECKEADESETKWEQGMSKEDHEWHPAGRVGKVEDVARAVDYLVESEFVTGDELTIDGGVTKKMVYPE